MCQCSVIQRHGPCPPPDRHRVTWCLWKSPRLGPWTLVPADSQIWALSEPGSPAGRGWNRIQVRPAMSGIRIMFTWWNHQRETPFSCPHASGAQSVFPLKWGHPWCWLLAYPFRDFKKWASPWASLVAHPVRNLPAVQESWVQSLGQEDPLEKGMATHSSILAWRIPWTGKPGGLQSMGLQRVGHDWASEHFTLNPSKSIFCIPFHLTQDIEYHQHCPALCFFPISKKSWRSFHVNTERSLILFFLNT